MIADLILLLAVGILAYAWIVYPLGVGWIGRRRRDLPAGRPEEPSDSPSVAVLVSAHNEERVIGERIENLLSLEYPPEKVDIYVGVDGSTDATAIIVQDYAARHPRVHAHVVPARRGKTAMLKDLVRLARAGEPVDGGRRPTRPPDALVFSDANTRFEGGALGRLVGGFAEPGVGGVCGRLVFQSRPGHRSEESKYWDWETWMKVGESALDSCLGANGAIYAIRPALFWTDIPENTIVDDFVIGMKVREAGYRMIYKPDAVAHEELPPLVQDEWGRRVRIGSGAFQALRLCASCLGPRYGVFAWSFWSHKVLRWFTPHLMIVGLAIGLGFLCASEAGWMRRGIGIASAALLVAGAAGALAGRARASLLLPFRLCFYFLAMQAALFCGFVRYCRGSLPGSWNRTAR